MIDTGAVEFRRELATRKLTEAMNRGRDQTLHMASAITSQVPTDFLVPKKEVSFRAVSETQTQMEMVANDGLRPGGLRMGNVAWGLHGNALGQLEQRLGVPARFVQDLMGEGQWGVDLAARMFTEMMPHRGKSERLLVRSVGGEARAVLSDRYKRLDSGMILESFVGAMQKVGAVARTARIFDTRWNVQVLLPQMFEPFPGEVVGFGASLAHSDFGNGALSYSFSILRLICINGMVGENELRKVHLGEELSGAVFSDRTLELQTKTACSAIDDVVSHSLSPRRIEMEMDRIRAAAGTEIPKPSEVISALQKAAKITKEEESTLQKVYVDGGIEELPQGNNAWRMAQALSRLATLAEEKGKGERAMQLEVLAGEVLDKFAPKPKVEG